jgi:cold shock CspA family protein
VFFHLKTFQSGPDIHPARCPTCSCETPVTTTPPPPILGEEVQVTFESVLPTERAPRALSVTRVQTPLQVGGIVEFYDSIRRYGFIQGMDDVSYHLHQSEIVGGRLPLPGMRATFFAGQREGRPRACHVQVCP